MSMEEYMLMNAPEVARELRVSERTVRDLFNRADFPTVRIGRRTLVSRDGLREWVRQQEQNTLTGVRA